MQRRSFENGRIHLNAKQRRCPRERERKRDGTERERKEEREKEIERERGGEGKIDGCNTSRDRPSVYTLGEKIHYMRELRRGRSPFAFRAMF